MFSSENLASYYDHYSFYIYSTVILFVAMLVINYLNNKRKSHLKHIHESQKITKTLAIAALVMLLVANIAGLIFNFLNTKTS
ncbi:hypothetical protein [Pantoea agglomerans]|uniref:hypothetical protein n=1 Tax=Enterobacter agglomerans TaxID=549 RepID=UPI00320B803D